MSWNVEITHTTLGIWQTLGRSEEVRAAELEWERYAKRKEQHEQKLGGQKSGYAQLCK